MFRSRTKDSDCSASFADSEPISTSCLREKKLILWPFVRRKRTPNRTFAIPELDHKKFEVGNWRLEIGDWRLEIRVFFRKFGISNLQLPMNCGSQIPRFQIQTFTHTSSPRTSHSQTLARSRSRRHVPSCSRTCQPCQLQITSPACMNPSLSGKPR